MSIYINPVVYNLLIKVAWGVAYINLLISGAKVKVQNYFTKIIVMYSNLRLRSIQSIFVSFLPTKYLLEVNFDFCHIIVCYAFKSVKKPNTS